MFPTTDWGLFERIRGRDASARGTALEVLASRYWRPVFLFIRQYGFDTTDAEDLTQDFFTQWLANDTFKKPYSAKGRFRGLLQTSLRRFLSNAARARKAGKRTPPGGLSSIRMVGNIGGPPIEPFHGETPESLFDRAWAITLVSRILGYLKKESDDTGKNVHYEIFRQRIVLPLLEGTTSPSMKDLAFHFGIDEKQAANALLTARRAYQRLLRDEIRLFAQSEDEVSAEVRDIFRALQPSASGAQSSVNIRV